MTDDWAGRDDDGDGIPNALDADPTTPARPAGWSITDDAAPAPADASGSDAAPPPAPSATPVTPLTPMPEPPAAPPADADQAAWQRYQEEMAKYSAMMELLSTTLKQMNDAQSNAIKNIRD